MGGSLNPEDRLNVATMRAVLAVLHETNAQTPEELADRLELTGPRIRLAFDRIVAEGMVIR